MTTLIKSELTTKTTDLQFATVQKLYDQGYYNLSKLDDNSVTMIKGPSYDKTKAIINSDGTYYCV